MNLKRLSLFPVNHVCYLGLDYVLDECVCLCPYRAELFTVCVCTVMDASRTSQQVYVWWEHALKAVVGAQV